MFYMEWESIFNQAKGILNLKNYVRIKNYMVFKLEEPSTKLYLKKLLFFVFFFLKNQNWDQGVVFKTRAAQH